MEGQLFLLYKNEIQLYRCKLVLSSLSSSNEIEKGNDIMFVYTYDNKEIKKEIPLFHVKKFSVQDDLSWEIVNEFGTVYKFLATENDENLKWIDVLLVYFNYRYANRRIIHDTASKELLNKHGKPNPIKDDMRKLIEKKIVKTPTETTEEGTVEEPKQIAEIKLTKQDDIIQLEPKIQPVQNVESNNDSEIKKEGNC
jgi:hypothetical protein